MAIGPGLVVSCTVKERDEVLYYLLVRCEECGAGCGNVLGTSVCDWSEDVDVMHGRGMRCCTFAWWLGLEVQRN